MKMKNNLMRTVAACCIMASPSCWSMANTIESQSANVEMTASDGEQKETNPLEGFWKKTWIRKKGDSQKGSQPFVHYKYYGENHMVSLSVWYTGANDVDVNFEGRCLPFEYVSKKNIIEGDDKLEIKTESENMFELFWTGQTPKGETEYEEGWERYAMPSGLAAIHQGVRNADRTNERYAGVWELQGLRQPQSGELIPIRLKNYKWYGDGYFIGFIPVRMEENRVYFRGKAGTFTSEGDSIIKERGGSNNTKWLSDDTFELTWFNGSGMVTEVWKRMNNSKMEQDMIKILRPMFRQVEGLSVADMYNHTTDSVYEKADAPAQYPGGMNALMAYFSSNMRYPQDCIKEKIEGRVMISFVVDKDGNVTQPKVIKSPDPRLSAEAIRVIMSMTKWEPARLDGKPVSLKLTLPLMFTLKEKMRM